MAIEDQRPAAATPPPAANDVKPLIGRKPVVAEGRMIAQPVEADRQNLHFQPHRPELFRHDLLGCMLLIGEARRSHQPLAKADQLVLAGRDRPPNPVRGE